MNGHAWAGRGIGNFFSHTFIITLAAVFISSYAQSATKNQKTSAASVLSVTAELQITNPDPAVARVFKTVELQLRSCSGADLGIRVYPDGENEQADQPNIEAGACITLSESSIPFDVIAAQAPDEYSQTVGPKNYQQIAVEAYFDARHSKPRIDMSHCLAEDSTVFFNKTNPRESYVRCEHNTSQSGYDGLRVASSATIYLMLFHYAGSINGIELPGFSIIVGLVE